MVTLTVADVADVAVKEFTVPEFAHSVPPEMSVEVTLLEVTFVMCPFVVVKSVLFKLDACNVPLTTLPDAFKVWMLAVPETVALVLVELVLLTVPVTDNVDDVAFQSKLLGACTAAVPFPTRSLFAVNEDAPVPPRGTVRVPVMLAAASDVKPAPLPIKLPPVKVVAVMLGSVKEPPIVMEPSKVALPVTASVLSKYVAPLTMAFPLTSRAWRGFVVLMPTRLGPDATIKTLDPKTASPKDCMLASNLPYPVESMLCTRSGAYAFGSDSNTLFVAL